MHKKVDELGELCSQEARNALEILDKQNLDVYIEEDAIIIKKITNSHMCVMRRIGKRTNKSWAFPCLLRLHYKY